jgi:hypothetical protein
VELGTSKHTENSCGEIVYDNKWRMTGAKVPMKLVFLAVVSPPGRTKNDKDCSLALSFCVDAGGTATKLGPLFQSSKPLRLLALQNPLYH